MPKDLAIHKACRAARVETVRKHLASKDRRGLGGECPLHILARASDHDYLTTAHVDCIRLLVEAGADVNLAEPQQGHTPLHGLARRQDELAGPSDVDAARILLEDGGARLDIQDSYQNTALHVAAQWGQRNLIEIFLHHNADVNSKGWSGQTPLHAASRYHARCVEYLVKNGADIHVRDASHGFQPLHIAASQKAVGCVKTLLELGARPSEKANDGSTPLHLAAAIDCSGDDPAAALALVKAGADPDVRMNCGSTPLHVAARCGFVAVAAALVRAGAGLLRPPLDCMRRPAAAVARGGCKELFQSVQTFGVPKIVFLILVRRLSTHMGGGTGLADSVGTLQALNIDVMRHIGDFITPPRLRVP